MSAALPTVGASVEVTQHHIAMHPCADWHEMPHSCPCGKCIAVLCSECGDAVLLALIDPGEWCEHAEQLYRQRCDPRGQR